MSDRIVSDPAIMRGKPVVRGTRITVETILEHLGAGESPARLCEEYPALTEDDVRAAVAYAVSRLREPPFQRAG